MDSVKEKFVNMFTCASQNSNPAETSVRRDQFSSSLDGVVSILGVAVGIGNIWRFPKLCFENGGGSFLIPYLIMLLFVGLPIFFLELSLGQYTGKGPLKLFNYLTPGFGGLGPSLVSVGTLFAFYYIVVISWSVFYFAESLNPSGPRWMSCGNDYNTATCWSFIDQANCSEGQYFYNGTCSAPADVCSYISKNSTFSFNNNSLSCIMENGTKTSVQKSLSTDEYFNRNMLGNEYNSTEGYSWENLGGVRWQNSLCLLLCWILVAGTLMKGARVQGKISYITTFAPYILLLILAVKAYTLEGAAEGIKYLFTPKMEKLRDLAVWKEAAIQIIFTLGSCSGTNLSLARYNSFKTNAQRNAIIIAMANSVTSIFTSTVIFSILGFLKHVKNVENIAEVVQGGDGLAFVVFPEVISYLSQDIGLPAAQFFAAIFFLVLILVSLGSSFGDFSVPVTAACEYWGVESEDKKWMVVWPAAACMWLCGLIFCTNGGIYVFRMFDSCVPSWNQLLLGLLEVGLVAYVWKLDNFMNIFNEMGITMSSTVKMFWMICWRYVTPLVVITLLITDLYEIDIYDQQYEEGFMTGKTLPPYVQLFGFVITASTMLAIPVVAMRRMSEAVPVLVKVKEGLVREDTETELPAMEMERMLETQMSLTESLRRNSTEDQIERQFSHGSN